LVADPRELALRAGVPLGDGLSVYGEPDAVVQHRTLEGPEGLPGSCYHTALCGDPVLECVQALAKQRQCGRIAIDDPGGEMLQLRPEGGQRVGIRLDPGEWLQKCRHVVIAPGAGVLSRERLGVGEVWDQLQNEFALLDDTG
jgi:hypothetical protein